MQIYNSLSRLKETFIPGDPERITMYVCGPTVYNFAHIGNARPPVVFDVLYRLLQVLYPNVVYARNITDVDDKINASAAEQGVDISVIANRYTQAYHEDMEALNVLPPAIEPFATDHIAEMIAMIEKLIESGHAYAADGHALFRVDKFEGYGQLSNRSLEDMIAGARVEVAPYKEHPGDFVLWKPSTENQPGWESPWGFGRPGWHLECSAMCEKHLGETIDIHGGGMDLRFPHHENERAQSICAHGGKDFVRYWMHNGFLSMDSEKMSKSLGNVLLVRELLEEQPGEVLRYLLISAHYRKPLDWNEEVLKNARKRLDKIYRCLENLQNITLNDDDLVPDERLMAALQDDLNTPEALAALAELVHRANSSTDTEERRQLKGSILASGDLLGLLQHDPAEWFMQNSEGKLAAEEIEKMIAERNDARKSRDFANADRIRDELAAAGVVIEDSADGTSWRYQS